MNIFYRITKFGFELNIRVQCLSLSFIQLLLLLLVTDFKSESYC